MRFYDLRKKLCDDKEVSGLVGLHCPGPGDDPVQCTAFTKRTEHTGLKLEMPKFDADSTTYKDTSDSASPVSASSDFDSDSDSGEHHVSTISPLSRLHFSDDKPSPG